MPDGNIQAALHAPQDGTATAVSKLPAHLRGPFIAGRMAMTAKDWARLRDPSGNSVVQHKMGDVVAIVFGENDEMEAERVSMLSAFPMMAAALQAMLTLCEGSLSADSDAVQAALSKARVALASAGLASTDGAAP